MESPRSAPTRPIESPNLLAASLIESPIRSAAAAIESPIASARAPSPESGWEPLLHSRRRSRATSEGT